MIDNGRGGSKIIQNCETSFMDDLLISFKLVCIDSFDDLISKKCRHIFSCTIR